MEAALDIISERWRREYLIHRFPDGRYQATSELGNFPLRYRTVMDFSENQAPTRLHIMEENNGNWRFSSDTKIEYGRNDHATLPIQIIVEAEESKWKQESERKLVRMTRLETTSLDWRNVNQEFQFLDLRELMESSEAQLRELLEQRESH